MRATLALISVSVLLLGCSSGRPTAKPERSLALLAQLSAGQQNFGVILDAKSGRALAAFRVNNPIRAAIPDGAGGWYIGGGFIHVNGILRKRLAHIPADRPPHPDLPAGGK